MRTLLARTLLASSLAVVVGLGAGCSRREAAEQRRELPTVTVDQLDRMLASHECRAVDANGDTTRKRMGVIPGAVLLRDMDAVDQLPADRSTGLVFYCANPACGASHEAAERAITAGYTHVLVLPDGIAGWVKAGKQTASI
ncbi:MAG TPA: rhodanese-like domain-containing protein [Kofleriaceae bacterium]|nr:rhodanese-like domain-containing protein [Kofleriaceae bacterium]HMG52066.1 rhodanese-like domain-containing protein [Kofleriaceae bacterium]